MSILSKIGFTSKKNFYGFLSVVLSGQIIYSAFEAFKGSFYNVLLEVLNIDNTQMGVLFTLIGSAIFFYIPAGWVNNRFSVKKILISGLLIRFVSMMVIIFFQPSFLLLIAIAAIWGLVDAIFWPAVVNGVSLMSGRNNKGMAFGLLESIRRATEMGMNAFIILIMALLGSTVFIFKNAMFAYSLLILPMIYLIWNLVPENKLEIKDGESKNIAAFKGLMYVLKIPTLWLAAFSSLTVYWVYITLIYTVPYLQVMFSLTTSQTAMFGIINTGAMGVIAGLVAGTLSDFVFKSSIKMMMFSLALSAVCLCVAILLPKRPDMLVVNIFLLLAFSFSIFLAKGIILAPIAEIKIPKEFSGAAMSVGSFAAYASVFWGYAINGWLIDNHDAITAYKYIFIVGAIVSSVGSVCSMILVRINRRQVSL